MKQILQDLANGKTVVEDVPWPASKKGFTLIKTYNTLISPGTEKMLVDFGKANLLQKVKSQPDKVKMVIDKAKTDGILATYEAVKSKLNQPLPLGYCNVGEVIDSPDNLFKPGTRVVSNGYHAEVVRVSNNLVSIVPENVDNESASFVVLSSIALQGIRLIKPTIGETVVVTGLGLIGLLAVQILLANGCKVIGIDYDLNKCKLAKSFGAETVNLSKGEDPIKAATDFSKGQGVDAVLIAASSNDSNIIHQAAEMCRKRGRIVLIGVINLNLDRNDFYEKELTFQVSCSYGPGRYDESYEVNGNDYPLPFVRWTEGRNFDAILDLMANGSLDIKPLISHRCSLDTAIDAYKSLGNSSSLGTIINYPSNSETLSDVSVDINHNKLKPQMVDSSNIAFIGVGNYASRVLIPAFKNTNVRLKTVISSGGISSIYHGRKNFFMNASTDISDAFKKDIDAVIIATQHNDHAKQILLALKNKKHVFVEKPLALTHSDIDLIEKEYYKNNKILMVGFNRRFAPHIKYIKSLIEKTNTPKVFNMTMNAGHIPANHWTQNKEIGGGRILGEACHYIDLMRYLSGSKIKSYQVTKIGKNNLIETDEDKAIITLSFCDGSIGTINYLANGGKTYPKEIIEIFCDNQTLRLNNFKTLKVYDWKGAKNKRSFNQDKGQLNCVSQFVDAISGKHSSPIPVDEVFEVARMSVDIAESLRD